MKTIRFYLMLVALMAVSMTVAAQTNPYPEEDDPDDYPQVVKFAGQKPTINDFVSTYIGDEPEDELTGKLYEMWQTYKIHYNNGVQSLGFDEEIKTGKEGTDEYPVVLYDLPRVGKDIKAIINYDNGSKKEVLIKWTGMKFDIQQ